MCVESMRPEAAWQDTCFRPGLSLLAADLAAPLPSLPTGLCSLGTYSFQGITSSSSGHWQLPHTAGISPTTSCLHYLDLHLCVLHSQPPNNPTLLMSDLHFPAPAHCFPAMQLLPSQHSPLTQTTLDQE